MAAPDSIEALGRLRSVPQGYERSKTGLDILACVTRVLERDPATWPRPERDRPVTNGASAVVQLLKVLLQSVSERHHVASKMIATVDELEQIASDDKADVPSLKGWRFDLLSCIPKSISTLAWLLSCT